MPIYLDRMPFQSREDELFVRGERVPIRQHQIIVWISLTEQRQLQPNTGTLPFPAILDTGHTHSFAIQERHLIEWAGLRPESLLVLGQLRDRERNKQLPRRQANL